MTAEGGQSVEMFLAEASWHKGNKNKFVETNKSVAASAAAFSDTFICQIYGLEARPSAYLWKV